MMKYWYIKELNVSNYFHGFHWLINRINYAFTLSIGMFIYDAVSFQFHLRTSCNYIFASAVPPPPLAFPQATLMAQHIHSCHMGFTKSVVRLLHYWALFVEKFSFHFRQNRTENVCDMNSIMLHNVIYHTGILALRLKLYIGANLYNVHLIFYISVCACVFVHTWLSAAWLLKKRDVLIPL